ncbi:hypothetical protein HELRODRAFT_86185, partial [Helobdella robusta]|uniref:Uncharacterized protein n=1 Tax=Helobdella robusta TaxID=6412 RepID=T1G682_HELRO
PNKAHNHDQQQHYHHGIRDLRCLLPHEHPFHWQPPHHYYFYREHPHYFHTLPRPHHYHHQPHHHHHHLNHSCLYTINNSTTQNHYTTAC